MSEAIRDTLRDDLELAIDVMRIGHSRRSPVGAAREAADRLAVALPDLVAERDRYKAALEACERALTTAIETTAPRNVLRPALDAARAALALAAKGDER